jgi:HJR/Mrr/RecB family endonuclease
MLIISAAKGLFGTGFPLPVLFVLCLFVLAVTVRLIAASKRHSPFAPERLPRPLVEAPASQPLRPVKAPAALGQSSAPSASAIDRVRALDWFQFERFMAALFSECGFAVQRFGGANPDGGLDLIVELSGKRCGVQCKHWKAWKVGVKEVREFVGALKDRSFEHGIFVTLNSYTADAKALAARNNVELADTPEIVRMLTAVGAHANPRLQAILNETRKLCPKCESEMVLRTSMHTSNLGAQFWGCSKFPRCKGRMDYAPPAVEMKHPHAANENGDNRYMPKDDAASSVDEPVRACVPKQYPAARYMPKDNVSASSAFRFH